MIRGNSSSRVLFSRDRLLGGNEVAAVQATSTLAMTSRRKTRANAHTRSGGAAIRSDLRPLQKSAP